MQQTLTLQRTVQEKFILASFLGAACIGLTLPASACSGLTAVNAKSITLAYTSQGRTSCGVAYGMLKRTLKDRAKRNCRMSAGSGGRAIKSTCFRKSSCSRPGAGRKRVSGTFYYLCR